MNSTLELLRSVIPEDRILTDEPMKKHTSFRTGGSADLFVIPETEEELSGILKSLRKNGIEHTVIGNGSNLLVSDRGYRGVVIQILSGFSGSKVRDTEIQAGGGELLSRIASAALENSLTGFEFASGIPGTAGGAMVMNAGAYGGEMKDVVRSVRVLDKDGEPLVLDNKDMGFGYRRSIIREAGYIVTGVVFSLEQGERKEILNRMEELKASRNEKQPLEFPSAGSTFKRPEGNFAGKLIMDAGLKGFSIGGARVSEKHCGFIINTGDATSDEIYKLIQTVREQVQEKYGVLLEPEVCMMGEFT